MRNRDDEFRAIAWPVGGVGAILIALIVLFAWTGAFGKTPPAGALCLPPGVPALDTMTVIQKRVISVTAILEDGREAPIVVTMTLFRSAGGASYGMTRLLGGAVAIVDDDPYNSDALNWWIDPGLVTDDVPPKVRALAPTSTCQWRRRGEKV